MSTANFDPRDRADRRIFPDRFDGKKWFYKEGVGDRIRFISRSGGYVLVRKRRAMPFVMTEKDWAKLPLFESFKPEGNAP